MATYQHILVGLDLSEECPTVLTKAKALADSTGATLTACHIVEPIAFAYGGDVPLDLSEAQQSLEEQAKLRLHSLLESNNVSVKQEIVLAGQAASELHHLAEELAADLIIVGSHGKHGFALLLGSTANGVLHGAKCDVLAVRV